MAQPEKRLSAKIGELPMFSDEPLTQDEKKELVKQLMADQEADEEPSDFDSDADGVMPPSAPVPQSHWVRGALVKETYDAVNEMADKGLLTREDLIVDNNEGMNAMTTSKRLMSGGRVQSQSLNGIRSIMATSGLSNYMRGSMTGSRVMGFSYGQGSSDQESFVHRKSSFQWGHPTVSQLAKKRYDPTKNAQDLPIGADIKVALVGDLGTKCVAHLPAKWTEAAITMRETIYDPEFYDDGTYGPMYIRNCIHSSLQYCSHTDTGGLEGATMRFRPEGSDAHNRGLPHIHKRLAELVKKKHPWISHADMFALAAYVVIETSGGPIMPLAVGRRDSDGKFFEGTSIPRPPVMPGRLPMPEQGLHDEELELQAVADAISRIFMGRVGVTPQQMVCLVCSGHSYGRCHQQISGYAGPWQHNPGRYNNMQPVNLIKEKWKLVDKNMVDKSGDLITGLRPRGIRRQYVNQNGEGSIMMLVSDMTFVRNPAWRPITEMYAKDENKMRRDFGIIFKAATELGWKKPEQPKNAQEKFWSWVDAIPTMTAAQIAEFICCREDTYYK